MEADCERSSAVQIDNSPVRSPDVARILPGYLVLYVALYLAYGTESAYLPAFLLSHGLSLEQIGLMLAIGTIVRIGAGPLIGRFADFTAAPKQVLSVAAFLSGLIGTAYNFAFG